MADLPHRIWTIGHSTHAIDSFLGLLHAHHIEAVADVRLMPGSRRYPHFNRETLSVSLEQIGVGYSHFPGLGGRRKPRPDSANTAWRNEAFRGYTDHMESAEFAQGMTRLTALAMQKPTALMCAEAVWWQCHRALISDLLKIRGVEVVHILSENKVERHPFTSAAQVIDGQLSYRAPREAATHAELPLT